MQIQSKKSYEQACLAMESCCVVSFDIFDTLLVRKVLRPIDVFRLMELELDLPEGGFCEWRVEAEQEARKRAPRLHSAEVSLEEIYDVLCAKDELFALGRSAILSRELEIEKAVCGAHPMGAALFTRARELGRRILLLSDMYLPEPFIEEMLRDQGYTGDFELYVSHAHRQSKANGALFKTVLGKVECPPSQILHLGDNWHSDFKMAKKAGWQAVHLPKLSDSLPETVTEQSLSKSILEALRLQREAEAIFSPSATRDFWERMGSEVAAPLYLGFITDLIEQTKYLGLNRIFFAPATGKS